MRTTITHDIETSSVQKATALRNKIAKLLEEDEDVTVTGSMLARQTLTYIVAGIDLKTEEPFEETVEADHADHAKELVEDKRRKVAAVQEVMHVPAESAEDLQPSQLPQ